MLVGSGALTVTVTGNELYEHVLCAGEWGGSGYYLRQQHVVEPGAYGCGCGERGDAFAHGRDARGPGGGTSAAVAFAVNNPLPVTNSISPGSATVHGDLADADGDGVELCGVVADCVEWGGADDDGGFAERADDGAAAGRLQLGECCDGGGYDARPGWWDVRDAGCSMWRRLPLLRSAAARMWTSMFPVRRRGVPR